MTMNENDKKLFFTGLVGRLNQLLPDENVEGQPFWGLMETAGGKLTGNYFVIPTTSLPSHKALPLFLRETDAEIFRTTRKEEDINKYVVRGFTREQLRTLTLFGKEDKLNFMVFQDPPNDGGDWLFRIYNAAELALEYLK